MFRRARTANLLDDWAFNMSWFPVEQKSNRYSYIDAARGFAALWVVCYHLWKRFYPGLSTQGGPLPGGPPGDSWDTFTLFAFGFGYSGITLFFVLSGLCIHLPQARRRVYRIDVSSFAARRFWRLYPAYLASIVFSVLALTLPKLLLAFQGRSFDWWAEAHAGDAVVNALFLQQIWPDSLGLNGVYWTLVYEMQFYVAYPALIWCIRKTSLGTMGAILLACEVYFAFSPSSIPCFFLGKYFEWYLGVLAAEVIVHRANRVSPTLLGLGMGIGLGGGVLSVFVPALYPLRDVLFATGYFGLILLIATSRGSLGTLFDLQILAGVGLFSYSLYLIHVPVIDLVWVGLDRLMSPRLQSPAAARWLSLAAVPISVIAAYVFYRLFERPFFHVKTHAAARPKKPPTEEGDSRTPLIYIG